VEQPLERCIPLFVVYKAGNIYQALMEGEPNGAHYAYTPSGWFDGCNNLNWFKTVSVSHQEKAWKEASDCQQLVLAHFC
jgi:hypothetical protein